MKKLLLSALLICTAISPIPASLTVPVLAQEITPLTGGSGTLNPDTEQVWNISYPGYESDQNYYSLAQIADWFSQNSSKFPKETITLSLQDDLTTTEHLSFPSSNASINIDGDGHTINYAGDGTCLLSSIYTAFLEIRSDVTVSNLNFNISAAQDLGNIISTAFYVTGQWDLDNVSFSGIDGNECGVFCTGPAEQEIDIDGCSFINLHEPFASTLVNNTLKVSGCYFKDNFNITSKFREITIDSSTFEGANQVSFAYQSGDKDVFSSDQTAFFVTGNYFGPETKVVLYAKAVLSQSNFKLKDNVFEKGSVLAVSGRRELVFDDKLQTFVPQWNGRITGILDLSQNFIWDYSAASDSEFVVPYLPTQPGLSEQLTITNSSWYEKGSKNPDGNGGIVSLPNTQVNFESNDFDHITMWVDNHTNTSSKLDVAAGTPIIVSAQAVDGFVPLFPFSIQQPMKSFH